MARIIPIPIGPVYPGGPCRGVIHVVQQGDTLYKLGKFYNVSVGQLIFANPFVDVYNLQVGDELCIPALMNPMPVGAGERSQYRGFSNWNELDGSADWADNQEYGMADWEDDATDGMND